MVNSKLLSPIVSNIARALYMFLLRGASHFRMDVILGKHISELMITQKLKTLLLIKKSWGETLLRMPAQSAYDLNTRARDKG